ncbi:MAG: hypothetical protein A2Y00_00350 [Omnitrophica WOR_2 bacterium GWF2_43_52]|nr:MAG: hypothetical protein A2062_00285 [Omnitrophica WOR_2 bacterium GWA2_44_7]OGX20916.1 MAG: hypothetical protein A2Y00_00350 [Omnitrophica WOR_2 bacterium GWF2_43_52]OGX57079.1 MAG: hypothetical protein A2460_09065 [Omnitrophica WOR_2 bacterium RIFOXYC2_FULL_43_9]HAH21092.1 ADP-ribose pyrophosphatase [Candidatus Omnitrophota bacterium]HBG63306.1 ADP-ribose pyrophosphatase [Candidatus Omnitrophota bacterium]
MAKTGVLYKGKLLCLFREKFLLPNKVTSEIEIIKHPGAALIAAFISSSRILLLKQFRPVVGAYLYELPAGTRRHKESPLLCAQREIVEETGYTAKKFTRLGEIFPVPGYSTEKITLYKAEGLTKVGRACPEEDEVIETYSVTRQQVRRLFTQGKIIDAKTLCALAFCGWLR